MPARDLRPNLEGLEGRILLYSTYGAQWTYSSRITYSFMPDGTSVGGTPSVLFQTLNSKYATATWEGQIEQAASIWEESANLNLALVPDGGEPVGTNGDQQDDPRFGDIRIGAIPLPSGVLAETFLPPPINGGTAAGDILFNSNVNWQIGTGFDLATVAAHEFGHALGLGESTAPDAVMYGTYDGLKDALYSDDIAGIQSLYSTPQYDMFNDAGTRNSTPLTPTNITPYINGSDQVALSGLIISYAGDAEYYSITVPANNSGSMTVTLQSSNLSSLAPMMAVYNSSWTALGIFSDPTTYGATISYTIPVVAGQKYYIRAGALGTYGNVGTYGLEVNFSSQTMAPIAPPNTVVAQQPDESGGSVNNAIVVGGSGSGHTFGGGPGLEMVTIGTISGWVGLMETSTSASGPSPTNTAAVPAQPAASIGALPALSANATAAVTPDPASDPDAEPTVAASPAASTPDVVLLAVDVTLLQWKGRHRRANVIDKHRNTHSSDHL